MAHSSGTLRYVLLRGLAPALAGRVVARREAAVDKWLTVRLHILEASHLVTYRLPGGAFSEILACLPQGPGEALADGGGGALLPGAQASLLHTIDAFTPLEDQSHGSAERGRAAVAGTAAGTERVYRLDGARYQVRIWRAPLPDPAYHDLLRRVRRRGEGIALLHEFGALPSAARNAAGGAPPPLTALLFDAPTATLHSAHSYPEEGCVVLSASRMSWEGWAPEARRA
ncbi:MAG: DUF2617 family protein [Candidatus Tectomicrobia bacterium]|nr:DUF2617 family protein [Candidatus Tectomicrobia bacterium]